MMTSSEQRSRPTEAWLRVSPVSLFYFGIKSASGLINLWPAIIALWASGDRLQALFWQFGLPAAIIIYFLSLWIQYWFFRYHEEADRIHIRSGVFNRRRLTLYYERVQQADIIHPFYFRPFGLATLGLESAGSAQQEVDIPGIPYLVAEQLKNKILAHRKKASAEIQTEDDNPKPAPGYQLWLSPLEVARYGLMHNGLLFLLPVFGALSQQSGNFLESFFASLSETWLVQGLLDFVQQTQGWLVVLAISISVTVGAAVLFLLSVLIALFRFWNYSLLRQGDQFQYRAGLATIKSRGFRLHKLQKITISQGIVARLLKRFTLIISKTGSGVTKPGENLQSEAKKFIVPVLTSEALGEFLQEVDCNVQFNDWCPISRFYIVWGSFCWGIVLTGTTLLVALFQGLSLWLPLCIQLSLIAIYWRRWRCYGFFQAESWLAIKTGFIGKKIVIVPIVKSQKISLYEPPWLRPRMLTHFWLWSGGGQVSIPYLPHPLAADIRARVMKSVVSYRHSWI